MNNIVASKAARYCRENVLPEDTRHIQKIMTAAKQDISEKFNLDFERYETLVVFYGTVFECILDALKEAQERNHPNCLIKIYKRLIIGYTNTTDDENRDADKEGNFAPYMDNLIKVSIDPGNMRNTYDEAARAKLAEMDDSDIPHEICKDWKLRNMEAGHDNLCDYIASKALGKLGSRSIKMHVIEYIFPIFSTIHENIVNYAIIQREDEKVPEFSLNILGYYTVNAYIDANTLTPVVSFTMLPKSKTMVKSDQTASCKYE